MRSLTSPPQVVVLGSRQVELPRDSQPPFTFHCLGGLSIVADKDFENVASGPDIQPSELQNHSPAAVAASHSSDTVYEGVFPNRAFVQDIISAALGPDAGWDPAVENASARRFNKPVYNSIGYSTPQSTKFDADIKNMILPPRHVADGFLHCYWELQNPTFPIIHRPTFQSDYQTLWQENNSSTDVVFHATLNILMALGCQRMDSKSREERYDISSEFYDRSQKLLSIETIDKYSLPIVQLLALRTLYLLFTPHAERCLAISRVALAAALSIGLDTQKLHMTHSDPLTREMRRRVWYCCKIVDA
jgi:hypothetical protein